MSMEAAARGAGAVVNIGVKSKSLARVNKQASPLASSASCEPKGEDLIVVFVTVLTSQGRKSPSSLIISILSTPPITDSSSSEAKWDSVPSGQED